MHVLMSGGDIKVSKTRLAAPQARHDTESITPAPNRT